VAPTEGSELWAFLRRAVARAGLELEPRAGGGQPASARTIHAGVAGLKGEARSFPVRLPPGEALLQPADAAAELGVWRDVALASIEREAAEAAREREAAVQAASPAPAKRQAPAGPRKGAGTRLASADDDHDY